MRPRASTTSASAGRQCLQARASRVPARPTPTPRKTSRLLVSTFPGGRRVRTERVLRLHRSKRHRGRTSRRGLRGDFLDEITNEGISPRTRSIAKSTSAFPFQQRLLSGEWKVGLKGDRFKEKEPGDVRVRLQRGRRAFPRLRQQLRVQPNPSSGARYTIEPFQRISAATDIVRQFDLEGEEETWKRSRGLRRTRDTLAGYGMAESPVGGRYDDYDRSSLRRHLDGLHRLRVPGGRGRDDSCDPSRSNSYGIWLPNVQVRYALSTDSNVRAAITRSLARPNFEDQLPAQLFNREDFEIERGNPLLDPTNAWNLDITYERFFRTVGLFSAGVFYKDLSDNIYFFNFEEERPDGTYEVTQPLNGDGAEVTGVELAYQNQFRERARLLERLRRLRQLHLHRLRSELPGPGLDSTSGPGPEQRQPGNLVRARWLLRSTLLEPPG